MSGGILRYLAEAQDGLFAVDMDQRIVLWNQSAQRILGYSTGEVLGKTCGDVLGGVSEDGAPVCGPICMSIHLARRANVAAPAQTILVRSRDGTGKWVNTSHFVLREASGEFLLLHIFHEARDEVEPRRLVQQLESLLSQTPRLSGDPISLVPTGTIKATQLTPRELDVLRLLAQGLSTTAIAERLVIRTTTTRNHIQRILTKLDAHSRLEAVRSAILRGIM